MSVNGLLETAYCLLTVLLTANMFYCTADLVMDSFIALSMSSELN